MDNPAQLASTLKDAVALHQAGRLDEARRRYESVLALAPRQFDALHLLGVIHRQQGDAARAVELITAALAIDPRQATAHCNLGAALQDLGRSLDALASYDAALRLQPAYALALANRGNALRRIGRPREAVDSYERALALKRDYAEAACNRAIALLDLGEMEAALAGSEAALAMRPRYPEALCVRANALFALRRFEDALRGYDAAIAADPQGVEAHGGRALALQKLGRNEEALADSERALALRPGHWPTCRRRADALLALDRRDEAIAGYQEAHARALEAGAIAGADDIAFALATLGIGTTPGRAPLAYVKALFDGYAGHFDRHLTEVLHYRTPALLAAALGRHVDREGLDTVDLGCGTGLCASFLRPLSRSLLGVDLSPRMLARAESRGLYDTLECADICAWLAGREDALDLVVAADVLVYFGDLARLFEQVRTALRPGGWFAFSTEALDAGADAGSFALRASSRYAHALGYLEALAAANGFEVLEAARDVVRSENAQDVDGYLLVLRAAPAQGVRPRSCTASDVLAPESGGSSGPG